MEGPGRVCGGWVVRKITIHCIHVLHFQRGDKAIFKRNRRMCVNGETFGSEPRAFPERTDWERPGLSMGSATSHSRVLD